MAYKEQADHIANSTKWNKENKDQRALIVKRYSFKKNYGITIEDYEILYNLQDGCCSICKTPQDELKHALHVDHNHVTKKVRGLLCKSCNTLLGNAKESLLVLQEAEKYLRDWS